MESTFQSDVLLSFAIGHARSSHIVGNSAIFASKFTNDRGSTQQYIGCVPDGVMGHMVAALRGANVQYATSYSSSSDALYCFSAFLDMGTLTTIRESGLSLLLLEPVPSIVKLDKSIVDFQLLLLYNKSEDSSEEGQKKEIVEHQPVSSTNSRTNSFTRRISSLSDPSTLKAASVAASLWHTRDVHPVIADIRSKEHTVVLSVMLHSTASKAQQERAAQQWLLQLRSSDFQDFKLLLHHHNFWAVGKKTAFDVGSGTNDALMNHSSSSGSISSSFHLLNETRRGLSVAMGRKDESSGRSAPSRFPFHKSFEKHNDDDDDDDGGSRLKDGLGARFRQSMEHYSLMHDMWADWADTIQALMIASQSQFQPQSQPQPQPRSQSQSAQSSQQPRQQQQHEKWRPRGSHICGSDTLEISHFRGNVHISLPLAWLKGISGPVVDLPQKYSRDSEKGVGESYSYLQQVSAENGACLAHLLTVVGADPLVSRIALSRAPRPLNNIARAISETGSKTEAEPFLEAGLDGTGVVVGMADTGLDQTSCFFREEDNAVVLRADFGHGNTVVDHSFRKVVQYVNYSGSGGDYSSGHGTHVAGTVAGLCAFESESTTENRNIYKGMAPNAKLAFFDIGIDNKQQDLTVPYDFSETLYPPAYQAGARIHTNSWGGGYLYDSFTITTDQYLYEHDDFLAIYAAGNSGSSGSETVVSPALSKNAVSVACSQNGHSSGHSIDRISSFSSQGPTADGRLKPDISAPGESLTSALARNEGSPGSSCNLASKSGTSMAAPVIGGSTALIFQYFTDPRFWAALCNPRYRFCRRGAFSPKGTLLKALILQSGSPLASYNGRVTLSNPPDVYQGYGRMDLSLLLPTVASDNESSSFTLYVDQGQLRELTERRYTVAVASSSQQLKVTLSWFDPPNEVFAGKYLLHDLDLVVEDPSGQYTFYGNSPNRDGIPAVGASRDETNTNEQVTVAVPAVGDWTVRVQAKRLSEALTQNFSIALTAAGVVTSDGEGDTVVELYPLSPALLQQCQATGARPNAEPNKALEVSKWARGSTSGWSSSDYYSLYAVGSLEDPPIAKAGQLVQQGYFTNYHSYAVDDICVTAGDYAISLRVGSKTKYGTQLSIAACDVFIAPLTPHQSFRVEPAVLQSNQPFNSSTLDAQVPVFPENACVSSCLAGRHVKLPLWLSEWEDGGGWSGTYYAVFRMPDDPYTPLAAPDDDEQDADSVYFAAYAQGGGSMEWGFEEFKEHCLPLPSATTVAQAVTADDTASIQRQSTMAGASALANAAGTSSSSPICYTVQLSVPSKMEKNFEYAELYFAGSYLIQDGVETDDYCPYEMDADVTLARVCLSSAFEASDSGSGNDRAGEGDATLSIVTFYTQNTPVRDLGQGTVSWSTFVEAQAAENIAEVGSCSLRALVVNADTDTPTAAPTSAAPSAAPTRAPTTTPTAAPSFTPVPSGMPTADPTSARPSALPTDIPTEAPVTAHPTTHTSTPTFTAAPTVSPSHAPTAVPSTPEPSNTPTAHPTSLGTAVPTLLPSRAPTPVNTLLPTVAPTATPTQLPSYAPTALPTESSSVTIAKTFGEHSLHCLEDCLGYPGLDIFATDMYDSCLFLVSVFDVCTSFSVAYGYCVVQPCAEDCTTVDWCYFAAGTSISCLGGKWQGEGADAQLLATQCVETLTNSDSTNGDENDGDGGDDDGDSSSGKSTSSSSHKNNDSNLDGGAEAVIISELLRSQSKSLLCLIDDHILQCYFLSSYSY